MKLQLKLMVINVGILHVLLLKSKRTNLRLQVNLMASNFTCNLSSNIRKKSTDVVMTIVNVTTVNAKMMNMFLTNGIRCHTLVMSE